MLSTVLRRTFLVLSLSVPALVSSCASTSGATSDKTIDRARGLTAELAELKTDLASTLTALEGVRAATDTKGFLSKEEVVVGDLDSAFKAFTKARATLTSQDATVAKRKQGFSGEFEAYMTAWEQNMATVENKDLKDAAAKRRAEARKRFESVQKELEGMTARYTSLLSDLQGIETVLRNDLTAQGVASVDGVIGGALKKGTGVQEDLDKVVTTLTGYTDSLAQRVAAEQPASK